MSNRNCSVYKCHNSEKKLKEWRNEPCELHVDQIHEKCECPAPYKFHRFPLHDEEKSKDWLVKIKRKNFTPTVNSRVCSHHFVDGCPSVKHPIPQLHLGYATNDVRQARRKRIRLFSPTTQRKRKIFQQLENACAEPSPAKTQTEGLATPSITKPSSTPETNTEDYKGNVPDSGNDQPKNKGKLTDIIGEYKKELLRSQEFMKQMSNTLELLLKEKDEKRMVNSATNTDTGLDLCSKCKQSLPKPVVNETDVANVTIDHSYAKAKVKTVIKKVETKKFCAENLSKKDSKFYTGLNLMVFQALILTFIQMGISFSKKLSVGDQLLMFLMRLRLGSMYKDLGDRFHVSQSAASKIVNGMLDQAALLLSTSICWLPTKTIRRTLPKSFKRFYPKTTVIIDCTEIFIQRARRLYARSLTYSHYKKHNTVKILVAIAPNGFCMFLSKPYGGRASDKHIVTNSGFLNYIRPGMEVMADRGFVIDSELAALGAKLNIPSFTKGLKQLRPRCVTRGRRISSVRIHVERQINRLKNFRILKYVFPIKSISSIPKIMLCCAALCNLQNPLIKPKP